MAKNNINAKLLTFGLILVIIVGLVWLLSSFGVIETSQSVTDVPTGVSKETQVALSSTCPTDGDTSMTISVVNVENTTGSEQFDLTGYLYKVVGSELQYVATISDTTSPTATVIDCGYEYKFIPVSSDGAGGDNSKVEVIRSGDGDVKLSSDGAVTFFAQGSSEAMILGLSQHGVLEVRAYDNMAKGIMCNNDDSCLDWEADGVTFVSTTNGTVYDETGGLDVEFDIRSTGSDTNFNDMGFYVLLDDFDTTTWEEPALFVNGVQLSDYTDSLNADEKKAYTGYDYVYKADVKILDAPNGVTVRIKANTLSGATASADPEIDIASIGKYLSIDGYTVKTGSVKDDIAKTTVFAVQDINIDITA